MYIDLIIDVALIAPNLPQNTQVAYLVDVLGVDVKVETFRELDISIAAR